VVLGSSPSFSDTQVLLLQKAAIRTEGGHKCFWCVSAYCGSVIHPGKCLCEDVDLLLSSDSTSPEFGEFNPRDVCVGHHDAFTRKLFDHQGTSEFLSQSTIFSIPNATVKRSWDVCPVVTFTCSHGTQRKFHLPKLVKMDSTTEAGIGDYCRLPNSPSSLVPLRNPWETLMKTTGH
jgi:hypothetical protein